MVSRVGDGKGERIWRLGGRALSTRSGGPIEWVTFGGATRQALNFPHVMENFFFAAAPAVSGSVPPDPTKGSTGITGSEL